MTFEQAIQSADDFLVNLSRGHADQDDFNAVMNGLLALWAPGLKEESAMKAREVRDAWNERNQ